LVHFLGTFWSEKNIIHEEIKKLLDAGFIQEVHHPWWLANPIVIPKAGRKLQLCIDYTSLNKACPKDPFPLPRIDQIVDSTSGSDLLCFLDAYSSFHQIPMSREDEEHTAFIIVDVIFYYVSMPYGVRNALPTFVRAMHKTFGDLIRDLIEVYVDGIIAKIKSHSSLLENLAIVYDRLRSACTMLNPDNCVFRVSTGKLLGFLVSHWGIEANLEKFKAIKVMCPPARIKDVLKLMGSMVAPRFLAIMVGALGSPAIPPWGSAIDVFCVDGGCSRISGIASQVAHRRCFLC
jgi:hypothetical protein